MALTACSTSQRELVHLRQAQQVGAGAVPAAIMGEIQSLQSEVGYARAQGTPPFNHCRNTAPHLAITTFLVYI